MKDICDILECTGCMACVNACTHNAIQIIKDNEGFDRPKINEQLCVDCGLCTKTCPMNSMPLMEEAKMAFSGWSSDNNVRISSSSGGAFTEIARPILELGGVVFGCVLNDSLQAEHTYVETLDELSEKLSGSKYVQSKIGKSYQQAKAFLNQGRKVLFSGTPCQIAGLKRYLRKDFDNLITVDLVCHGVPSPMLFEDYKKFIQKHENMNLTNVRFRCKKSSWIFFNMSLQGHVEKSSAPKTHIGSYYEDPYIRGFLRDYFLRPSCHQCKFTSTKRCSDFTIADYWGYRKESSKDKDFRKKGVSLILANTDKAIEMLPKLRIELRERTMDEAKKTNSSLFQSFAMPAIRTNFWIDYKNMPFEEMVTKYMSPQKVKWQTKIMEHYPNSDNMIMLISIAELPQRIIRKILKLTGLKKKQ